MDLSFNEPQQMLKNMARDFLENECPPTFVRAMEVDDKGYTPEFWRKMAELGWLGLVFPEQYGGTEGDLVDLAILLEEMGRACCPGPYFSTVVLAGLTILEAGGDAQKQEFLPKIAEGELIATLAITEPTATYEASGIETTAVFNGDDYVINGTKLFVPDAQVSDYLIVAARSKQNANPEEGITLLIVPSNSAGITVTPHKTIASDKQAEVSFKDVRVSRANMLGKEGQGWAIAKRAIERAAVGKCAEMLGGGEKVLEMTVEYAKQRVQFGRPIGSFQAIQHHCANMATDVEGCRFITYHAAWALSDHEDATQDVSNAKAWVSDAYRRVVSLGHQSHGAIGFTKEHNLQLYYRRAKAAELAYGDADYHREIVAQGLGM